MTCPKCHGEMRVYERSGVTVDQCTECRGIFLDRGELESILNAEQQYMASSAPPPYQGGGGAPHRGGHYPDSPKGYGRGGYPDSPKGYHGGHGGHGYRKRKSFMEQLFD